MKKTIKTNIPESISFNKENPGFDLLNFDFHNEEEVSRLREQLAVKTAAVKKLKSKKTTAEPIEQYTLDQLKAVQRMMRILPDMAIAEQLIANGYDAAHKIAAISQRKFVRHLAPVINDQEKVKEIYKHAVHISETTMHLYANVKDAIASPHYNASNFKISNRETIEYFQKIPSYPELFGSLDYLECNECQSIFSPAAYFVDIMRITDEYITDPNTGLVRTIPPGYTLEERRPDLFNIPLNCENTNTVIPYLELVNGVIKANLEHNYAIADAYKTLSVGKYPFELPYNLPQSRIREYLNKLGLPLYQLFNSILGQETKPNDIHLFDIALEYLNLSYQQFKIISKEDFSIAALGLAYGYNISEQPPAYDGSGNLVFLKDQKKVTGLGTLFSSEIEVNDEILVADEIKKVTSIESDTQLNVDSNWSVYSGSAYFVVPAEGQTFDGTGTLSISLSSPNITGTGTKFLTQLKVGDQISLANVVRFISVITSDTALVVTENMPFFSTDLPFKFTTPTIPPYLGTGIIITIEGSNSVAGMGTTFRTDFTQGRLIKIDGVTKKITAVQSDTLLSTENNWDKNLGTTFFVNPQAAVQPITAYLPHAGRGTLSFSMDSGQTTGAQTKFLTELIIGDQIHCANEVRTVIEISSDTQLTVSAKWNIMTTGATFEILPVNGMDVVENFIDRCNLDRPGLEQLFVQNLSPGELEAGAAEQLYINHTGEDHNYLKTYFTNDPANPVQRVEGITLKRLDRVHRFVRLAQETGWSFSDLNWLLNTYDPTGLKPLDELLILYLAQVKTQQTALPDLSVPAITALWTDMKTSGKVSDQRPMDLFDTVFNNPIFLDGKDPYKDDIPFNPFRGITQKWIIASVNGMDGTIRNRLSAALYLDSDQVVSLGNYVYKLTGGTQNALYLHLTNLSWLYRISQWSSLLALSLDELQNFLCLEYYPGSAYLSPPVNAIQPNAQTFLQLNNTIQKLNGTDLDVYQLNYILKGETGTRYEPPYQPEDLPPFLVELSAAAVSSKLKASDFVFENIDASKANFIYSGMTGKYISDAGIFLKYEFNYLDAAVYFPVTGVADLFESGFKANSFSLTFPDITVEQSTQVFDQLRTMTILIYVTGSTTTALLSETYTEETSLDALLTIFGDDNAHYKVNEVRSLLLQSKSAIAHTLKVWNDTEIKQQNIFTGWLSGFISAQQSTAEALKSYASETSKLPDYLNAFLSPGITLSEPMRKFVAILSRESLLAEHLVLTAKEIAFIFSPAGHSHFNIPDLENLTIGNIVSLIDYRKLVTDLSDRNDDLIDYFILPPAILPTSDKIQKLSSITGWDPVQISMLINLFWPQDIHPDQNYNTVSGLLRLQQSFNSAQKLGTDVSIMMSFSALGRLDLDPNGVFNDPNWSIFENLSNQTVSLTGSRFGENEFAEINSEATGRLLTQTRNALLPFALWLISSKNPAISKTSDLYSYLLIDVEMSSCAQTSKIAQGIASVQLYMQRSRMMLEPGVNIIDIPVIWWDWMSSYRIWEVNRKIFLYPESYIEPALRKKVTPTFDQFEDDLLQNDINKHTVKEPYQKYLQEVDLLGNLVYISSYNTDRRDAETGEEKETLFLFGRTNTQPYGYYMRKLDDLVDWGPWLNIDITINASSITPVYAFDRIFIFWSEKSITQSSTVKGQDSSTQTVEIVDMKFSFYDGDKWVHPQVLFSKVPINTFPSNYQSIQNPQIESLLNDQNSYWNAPYVLSSGRGNIGSGRVNLSSGLNLVEGTHTQFLRETKVGDVIWCMGEKRIVGGVSSNVLLVVTVPWSKTSGSCEYKIVPRNSKVTISPFIGTGKVTVTKDLQNVTGVGSLFKDEFTYGDNIVIGNETRMVILISSNTEMLVDAPWTVSAANSSYTVSPKRDKEEQLIVMFGADLPTAYKGTVTKPDIEANSTKNLFISERNELNLSLYNSMRLAQLMESLPIKGDVTMGPVQIVDSYLLKTGTNLVLADYKYAAASNPQPYKAVLDRQQANLMVVPDDNPLQNNYWGNNVAGTTNNPGLTDSSNAMRLLYYTDEEKSSLYNVCNQPGWFLFDNSDEAFLIKVQQDNLNKLTDMALIRPYPILPDMLNNKVISTQAFTVNPVPFNQLKFKFTRLTTTVTSQLMQKLFAGGIDNLLTLRSQEIPELPFSRFYPAPGNTAPDCVIPPESMVMDFDGAYGPYFWEIFFHGPFLIADSLCSNQRFSDAKQWLEYIFDPTVNEDDSAAPDPEKRYWRFRPFRTMARESLQSILTNPSQIRKYNYDPFDPDAIAKYRHVAYAKAIVMKYIDNILEWGDFLFTQDTSEAIGQATNLYTLASDLLGKRPESLGKLPAPASKTFNDIRKTYPDDIPQFLIELENTPEVYASESNTVSLAGVPFNKINSYFCVPENADFVKYWDKVEDRLFKIRHCQNINGVYRQLPLFAAPIDPRAFIRAYSAGSGGFSLGYPFSAPIPYFKFSTLIEKARNLTGQVGSLGSALLTALEKKDAEALSLISLQQEKTVLQLTTAMKELQIKVVEQQNAAQQQSLNNASYRYTHYENLIKEGISEREQVSMDAALAAMLLNSIGSITKTAAAIGYAVPQVGSPFAMTYGGQQIGNALNAASGAFEIGAIISSYVSQQALTMAGYDRRTSEWTLQRDTAGYDKAQIEAQLKENDLQEQIARQDLKVHQQNIKNNEQTELYYTQKFTNKELYQWMATRISTVYFQAYNLAYNMAKAAERAYQFENGTDRNFINYGYWDDRYKGLGAADGLMLAIDQMDSSSILEQGYRTLEIEKTISLLQLNPKSLIDLKTKGVCIFEFNEKLFDYDFPGQYTRKIKTISISIPAVVGPYQNIHASLTQLSNQLILTADGKGLDAVNYLLGGDVNKIPDSSVLRSNWWANQQIALSKGLNDSGLFELSFGDPRFLPFEGTGAVSTWRLSMPFANNRINFEAISDVVIQLSYTAMDGGDKFREDVKKMKALKPYSGVGYFNLHQLYASSWYLFMNDHTVANQQRMTFELLNFIPPNVLKAKLIGFYFRLDAALPAAGSYISFKLSDTLTIPLVLGPNNDISYYLKPNGKQEPDISKILGNRSIDFNLTAAPGVLKGKDGFLDPEVLTNIEIIFYYDAETGAS